MKKMLKSEPKAEFSRAFFIFQILLMGVKWPLDILKPASDLFSQLYGPSGGDPVIRSP